MKYSITVRPSRTPQSRLGVLADPALPKLLKRVRAAGRDLVREGCRVQWQAHNKNTKSNSKLAAMLKGYNLSSKQVSEIYDFVVTGRTPEDFAAETRWEKMVREESLKGIKVSHVPIVNDLDL